ncbi:hypothetical protein P4U03_20030 [Bacillus mycoides]|uniref:hypothetical protein n=1 Tax=Bacillus cereus group TaxID=86661 RepID=UPI0015933BFD|nr:MULTISPECIES: hypothetical protein [Bacillus cereus group]MED1268838.1 hypothetical protein [Bacillus mycoides]
MADVFETDSSGIHTLGGFTYQIRVFVWYLTKLRTNMQLEFETYDDVTIKETDIDTLDLNESSFNHTLFKENEIQAIQVKRTTIDNGTALKVLMNWILLESYNSYISKYILVTPESYGNKNILFNMTAEDLFLKIDQEELKDKPRSIIGKLKKQFINNETLFINTYKAVEGKVEFKAVEDIDDSIMKAYEDLFRKRDGEDKEKVYIDRIKMLLEKITYEILENINNKQAYTIKRSEFLELVEKISCEINDKHVQLDYSQYKETKKNLNIKDEKIVSSREYIQLNECELDSKEMKDHMIYMLYYSRYRLMTLGRHRVQKIETIEDTTYANFSSVKRRLRLEKKEHPFFRLDGTKNESNSYANNEQIRWGSAIFLTKENTDDDKKISWKDEECE